MIKTPSLVHPVLIPISPAFTSPPLRFYSHLELSNQLNKACRVQFNAIRPTSGQKRTQVGFASVRNLKVGSLPVVQLGCVLEPCQPCNAM